jgi:hypothetical protein
MAATLAAAVRMGACKPSSQSDSPLATEAVADAARCVVHVGRATAKACMKFRMHMLSEFFFSRLLNAIYPLILTLCWERGFDANSFKAYSAAPTCSSRHWSCRFAAKTRHVPQALQRRPR